MENTMPRPVATTIPERNAVPYQDSIPDSSIPDFYPMIPPIVRHARDRNELTSKDVDLISLMMGYHNDKNTLVWPSQATLAARMHVRSVDTIQRCLRRIIALGLIKRVRERAARGRFDKVKWDLAALWSDLDRHLEKSRLKRKAHHAAHKNDHAANAAARRGAKGSRPSRAGRHADFFGPTMPQQSGPEAEPEFVVEADNSGEAECGPQPTPSAVVVAFRDFSLGADTALVWEAKLGEAQCLEAARLMAVQRSAKKIENLPGYFLGLLKNRLGQVTAQAQAAKAKAIKALAPKPRPAAVPKPAPAPDPLDALPQEARTTLEKQVRAELASGAEGYVRDGLMGSKYAGRVKGRMRDMLSAGWEFAGTGQTAAAPAEAASASESVPSADVIAVSMPPVPAKYLSTQDLEAEWAGLSEGRKQPYRAKAQAESQSLYGERAAKPEAVENRAMHIYIGERKPTALKKQGTERKQS